MQNHDIEIETTEYGKERLNSSTKLDSMPRPLSDTLDSNAETVHIPIATSVKRFLRKNKDDIIIALMALVLAGGVKTLITLNVNYSVIETKLDNLCAQVEELSADSVTQEMLNIQIEALRLELSSAQNLNRTEIDNRINILEQQIAFLKENKP